MLDVYYDHECTLVLLPNTQNNLSIAVTKEKLN